MSRQRDWSKASRFKRADKPIGAVTEKRAAYAARRQAELRAAARRARET
jgi:hypothetical protein